MADCRLLSKCCISINSYILGLDWQQFSCQNLRQFRKFINQYFCSNWVALLQRAQILSYFFLSGAKRRINPFDVQLNLNFPKITKSLPRSPMKARVGDISLPKLQWPQEIRAFIHTKVWERSRQFNLHKLQNCQSKALFSLQNRPSVSWLASALVFPPFF